ncbi:MAG: SPOR domain-containing protein, partial [Sulfurimicrobium sp.]
KAKLALMGIEATIQTATVPDKGVWHRVRIGPYNNVDDLNRMRATLSQNGVSASLVKVHDPAQASTPAH